MVQSQPVKIEFSQQAKNMFSDLTKSIEKLTKAAERIARDCEKLERIQKEMRSNESSEQSTSDQS